MTSKASPHTVPVTESTVVEPQLVVDVANAAAGASASAAAASAPTPIARVLFPSVSMLSPIYGVLVRGRPYLAQGDSVVGVSDRAQARIPPWVRAHDAGMVTFPGPQPAEALLDHIEEGADLILPLANGE